jgi:hypothetical protein
MPSYTSSALRGGHFVPETSTDPVAQRKLRGQLESIDYTAFASNREIVGHTIGHVDSSAFQRMAVACAAARARWVKEAMIIAAESPTPAPERIRKLAEMRQAFEELSAAYEGARRLVERGYMNYRIDHP